MAARAARYLAEFGEPVTHRRHGDCPADETVQAVAIEEKPERDRQAGDENLRVMRIQVAAGLEVTKGTEWVIRGEKWITERIGTPVAGLLKLWATRTDKGLRTKARAGI